MRKNETEGHRKANAMLLAVVEFAAKYVGKNFRHDPYMKGYGDCAVKVLDIIGSTQPQAPETSR